MCSKRSLATPSVSSGEERERSNGGYGSVPGSNLSPRYTSSDHSCSQEPSHSLPVLSCWVFMAQGLAESGRMTARVADIIFKSWWTSKWAKQLDIEECSKAPCFLRHQQKTALWQGQSRNDPPRYQETARGFRIILTWRKVLSFPVRCEMVRIVAIQL